MIRLDNIQVIVDKFIKNKKTISIIDCSMGGCFINAITNMVYGSDILKFGLVTYSYDFLDKTGIVSDISDGNITVIKEISKKISDFGNSNYGIGLSLIFGSLVYVSVYDRDNDKYYTLSIDIDSENMEDSKRIVVNSITLLLLTIV